MSATVTRFGKQILLDGREIAQAADEEAAALIVRALQTASTDAVLDGPNGAEFGQSIGRRAAQPNYRALGIDDPEGQN